MSTMKDLRNGLIAGAGAIGAIAAFCVGYVAAYRHKIRKKCKQFYSESKRQFVIPGLKDGFDPQDLFYVESEGIWLLSGYNPRKSEDRISPIYKIDSTGKVSKLKIKLPNGLIYKGHGAAVSATEEYVFLTVKDGYVVMNKSSVLEANDGDTIAAFAHVPVGLEPAFMNIQDGILYIGEFYHKFFYNTPQSHWLETPEGVKNPALMFAYDSSNSADAIFGFEPRPSRVYSIPAEIQGMCVMPENRIVLSQSWGYGTSEMIVYGTGSAIKTDNSEEATLTYEVTGEEVPLYFLYPSVEEKRITLPPMAEGIVSHDGEVWISNESASGIYILGKFNGGKYVYSISV